MSYSFTNNWFENQKPVVQKFFPKSETDIHILEIGAHEGAGTVFYADNYLGAPNSSLITIDPFDSSDPTSPVSDSTIEIFKHNISMCKSFKKISHFRDYSFKILPVLLASGKQFDYISVDGSHLPKDILLDGILSFHLTKKGGIIFFDDYMGANGTLKETFDTITRAFEKEITVLHCGYHLVIRKN